MDKYTPIVILFGPPICGKTMVLLRLIRYLENNGFIVEPVANYRPNDSYYQQICDDFHRIVYNDIVNIQIKYLMVKVLDRRGRSICYILKIPGQLCFDPSFFPPQPVTNAITNILSLPNRRIWMFMQELDDMWQSITIRNAYVARIHQMAQLLNNDNVIFVCNKIDKKPVLMLPNRLPNNKAILNELESLYGGIFAVFEIRNPIIRLFRKYNFSFVPFSSGSFSNNSYGKVVYIPSEEYYPRLLWNAIMKAVRK